jgi:glycosyltransferase involved in cell wall biosynthesis
METMKFLMTTTFYPPLHIGGDAVHVKYLAEELVKRGHEVHVMHSVDAYRMKRGKGMPDENRADGPVVHPLQSPWGAASIYKTYAFGRSVFHEREYERILREVGPDVVHHHNISLLGHTLFRKRGSYRQLYTAHDYWLICQRNNLMKGGSVCDRRGCVWCCMSGGKPPQFWRSRLRLGEIDCTIVPSNYMAEKLAGLDLRITVHPNFVPEPPEEIPNIEEEDFFLFMGVVDEHKGIRILLEAFSKSKQKLIIIGAGPMAGWVQKVIEEKGLAPRVKYLGWKSEGRWPYLKKANALLIPSTGLENHPLSALEAMSVGTPTVCSDMGGTKEISSMISDGWVIPVDDLKTRLIDLVLPKHTREHIINIYHANFSPNVYLTKYENIAKGTCQGTR